MPGAFDNNEPGLDIIPVTKSDTVADPNGPFRGIMISLAAEAVKITTLAGNARTLPVDLAPGVVHPIGFIKVFSTGTGGSVAVRGIR